MSFRTTISLSSGSLALLLSSLAQAEYGLNMPQGVTEISNKIFDLHMLIFWVCVWIAVVVFGVMFYSIYKHRKSKGAVAADFHESTFMEIMWTVIPTAILIAMAIPATTVLAELYNADDADIDIKVTGYQWKWQYEYLGEDIGFFSNIVTPDEQIYENTDKGENYLLEVDKPMVIPTGKKVRFLLTSADVIHSWWVPEFAVKKDTIPGFVNESWVIVPEGKEGIYRGQCTELCGVYHGFMPIEVHAVTQGEYEDWLDAKAAEKAADLAASQQNYTYDELMRMGEEVYARACAACHGQKGEGLGSVFPALVGSEVALGDINLHIDIILNGVNGTAMQSFAAQLNDVEIAAVTTYERNAWGNNTGDTVTPKDVAARR